MPETREELLSPHDELYRNASVSLEFALYELQTFPRDTRRCVALLREAQASVKRAMQSLAATPAPTPGETDA